MDFHAHQNEHEHRYRQLAASLPVAVYSCDTEGRVTEFNRAAVRLWGRTPVAGAEFWCGSHAMFTLDGTRLPHDQCPMALAVREAREVGRIEAVVERPCGERRYVLAHPQLTRNQAGAITGAINVVVDITERKLLEERLRETDRGKDAFFSTLAHELRNPLSPIMSAASLLARSDDPGVTRMAGIIVRQAAMLERLVDDLFDASRITRGGAPLRMADTTLARVLDRALDTVRAPLTARRQTLGVESPPGEVALHCDEVRVAQLIGNVLLNASKYTPPEGAIRLSVRIDCDNLLVTVSDNGIGIEADRLEQIFQLYAQVDGADMHGKGGMGIGLALVRDLCERHGGTVRAHSDGPGRGSRFEIVLPVVVSGA
ncbi:PAS domain S-box protein [Massilia atriviolacea]|uniref:histidine kinase n=1 Tax=Massilia atriviolacea TaxID=2495579 RepID=A0A430HSV4_9BURK|nr:HAMP domain-containing sensor histidine kinase [Massilia atriviolacea]RSZ60600.1 PAS domain-containing sensor histidine kinase [Massilia atriviolacea]